MWLGKESGKQAKGLNTGRWLGAHPTGLHELLYLRPKLAGNIILETAIVNYHESLQDDDPVLPVPLNTMRPCFFKKDSQVAGSLVGKLVCAGQRDQQSFKEELDHRLSDLAICCEQIDQTQLNH